MVALHTEKCRSGRVGLVGCRKYEGARDAMLYCVPGCIKLVS